jgi:hypothetical protein
MPRLARLNAPGVFHHIIIRGIERRMILRNKRDRENFLEGLVFLGGAGNGKFPCFPGPTPGNESSGGWLCRTKRRGHCS